MPTDLQPLIDRVAETLVFRSYAERDEAVRQVKDAVVSGELYSYLTVHPPSMSCTVFLPLFRPMGGRPRFDFQEEMSVERLNDRLPHDPDTGRILDVEPLVQAFMACRVEGA